jgi:DNA-binding transcriptional LysR family regulator
LKGREKARHSSPFTHYASRITGIKRVMDIWQLNIFCKVLALKSFSKAGDAVHISQPTVSSHIKYLENYYGIKLIDRLPKEAVPTKAGALLFSYAKRIIALKEEAESAMAEFQGNIKGTLLLGGSNIPGVYLLPRIIGAFKQAYPHVNISLAIGDTEEITQGVMDGVIELGIVGAVSDAKNISQEILIEDEMCLVIPATHTLRDKKRIKLSRLVQEPFIVREKGSGTLKSIQLSLEKRSYQIEQLNIVAEMGSTAAVIQGIKSGVGISILSMIAVAEDIASGALKSLSIEGLNLKRYFYLTQHNFRSISPVNKAFIQFLRNAYKSATSINTG